MGEEGQRKEEVTHKRFQNICNAWTDYYMEFRQAFSTISIVIFTETLDKILKQHAKQYGESTLLES